MFVRASRVTGVTARERIQAMAARGLTPIAIDALKPRATRYEVPDQGCAGLYVIVQPSGKRSFALRYRHEGRTRKLTLGKGAMPLAEARKAATAAMAALERGTDPGAVKLEEAELEALKKRDTLATIAAEYLKREGGKLRTLRARESIFRRHIFPELGNKPITEISRRDVVRMLDKIEDDSGPGAADHAL